jgi:putative membrane protein
MGLANLVPGISGGTMLLAAGVYPAFISGIAELTRLRFRPRSLLTLGAIVATAALGILLFAGGVKALVVEHRWAMYSLFIGLTLGGVPLVWRMAQPANSSVALGAAGAFALMVAMSLTSAAGSGGREPDPGLFFVAGLAGASAMILPGISGGYLFLLLGVYEGILGTIDRLKTGLLGDASGSGFDLAVVLDSMTLVVPLGLGVLGGVVGVSNLLRWLLARYEKATLGALLGLLFGAVVGLWPFQQGVPPAPGDVLRGRVVSAAMAASIEPDDWRVERFQPTPGQLASSVALVAAGFAATLLLGRLGREDDAPEGVAPG